MKLIQLNMWGGRLDYRINDFIKREDPDILCLQEAIELPGDRGVLFTSAGDLQKILGAESYYMSPAFSFNLMHRKANFGNCIISKLPILNPETTFTGGEYVPDFDWIEHTQNIRNLQHVQLQLPSGEVLHLFNHHGHHSHEHKNGNAETMRQCRIIADAIKACTGQIVLAGDFNLVPHSKSLEQINALLKNLSLEAGLQTTRNELTILTEVCDYIFVNDKVQVTSFNATGDLISDHQALIMNFK